MNFPASRIPAILHVQINLTFMMMATKRSSNTAADFWEEKSSAAEGILEKFGLKNALEYLIGEKLFSFVSASERNAEFAAELPRFVAEIQRIFTAEQIQDYLHELKRSRFRSTINPALNPDDSDKAPSVDRLQRVAELRRFARIRELFETPPLRMKGSPAKPEHGSARDV